MDNESSVDRQGLEPMGKPSSQPDVPQPEKNPFRYVPGHPSHTHPEAPDGPDWWRRKGGWDKFAANVQEQALYLEVVYKRLQFVHQVREQNFLDKAKKFQGTIRRIRAGYADIRQMVTKYERMYAELQVKIREVESAMKRGALALTPEEWDKLRKDEVAKHMAKPLVIKPLKRQLKKQKPE